MKQAAREAAKLRRAQGDLKDLPAATDNLLTYLQPFAGKIIAGYMPIGTEIDPRPAMRALVQSGQIAVPVVVAKDQPLRFDLWTPDMQMKEGVFGAMIPAQSQPVTPEIIITPLLAFDRSGTRLGYGGGFYDRSFAALPSVLKVGLAYDIQGVDQLPSEPTDVKLDAVVSEKGVLVF